MSLNCCSLFQQWRTFEFCCRVVACPSVYLSVCDNAAQNSRPLGFTRTSYLPIKREPASEHFSSALLTQGSDWKAWVAKCNATTTDSLTHSLTHPRENVVTHETGQRSASEFGLCSSYLWRFAKSIFEKEHPSKTLRDNFIGQGISKHQSDLLYWWNQQKESGEMSDILYNGINTNITLQN